MTCLVPRVHRCDQCQCCCRWRKAFYLLKHTEDTLMYPWRMGQCSAVREFVCYLWWDSSWWPHSDSREQGILPVGSLSASLGSWYFICYFQGSLFGLMDWMPGEKILIFELVYHGLLQRQSPRIDREESDESLSVIGAGLSSSWISGEPLCCTEHWLSKSRLQHTCRLVVFRADYFSMQETSLEESVLCQEVCFSRWVSQCGELSLLQAILSYWLAE